VTYISVVAPPLPVRCSSFNHQVILLQQSVIPAQAGIQRPRPNYGSDCWKLRIPGFRSVPDDGEEGLGLR